MASVEMFVLGVTGGLADDYPLVEFAAENDGSGVAYTLEHRGGEKFVDSHVYLMYNGTSSGQVTEQWGTSGELVVPGDTRTLSESAVPGTKIRVVWNAGATSTSVQLARFQA